MPKATSTNVEPVVQGKLLHPLVVTPAAPKKVEVEAEVAWSPLNGVRISAKVTVTPR